MQWKICHWWTVKHRWVYLSLYWGLFTLLLPYIPYPFWTADILGCLFCASLCSASCSPCSPATIRSAASFHNFYPWWALIRYHQLMMLLCLWTRFPFRWRCCWCSSSLLIPVNLLPMCCICGTWLGILANYTVVLLYLARAVFWLVLHAKFAVIFVIDNSVQQNFTVQQTKFYHRK